MQKELKQNKSKNLFLTGYLIGNIYKFHKLDYEFHDYMSCNSYEELKFKLDCEYDYAIGYSLGGRILLRLIAEQHIKVKHLYIIAAPYYVHQYDDFKYGMTEQTFKFLGKILYSLPDLLVNSILKTLYHIKLIPNKNWSLEKIKYWYNFLNTPFPLSKNLDTEITIIHGDKDFIVAHENAKYISNKLEGELITLKNTGHLLAPFKCAKFLTNKI